MSTENRAVHGAPKTVPVPAFRTFEDLEVYQAARAFRRTMYAVSRGLPDFERFELASQIRRAAVSLTNNIAEGHGRFHWLEQIKFTLYSRGSLEELIDDLNVCQDEGYLPAEEVVAHSQEAWRAHQLINGYLRYLRQRQQGESLTLHDSEEPPGLKTLDLDALAEPINDHRPG